MIGIFINLWNRLIGAGGAAISYVLDEYSGAAAAYSLRKLSSTYGGSAVRVRRASDNAEQDIGFVGQDLDETALMNFVGYQNLLQRSEEFENVYWRKDDVVITQNTTTSPNGTLTADTLSDTSISNNHQIVSGNVSLTPNDYTFSFYIKANTSTKNIIIFPSGSPTDYIILTQNGDFVQKVGTSIYSYGSQDVGNGWRRFWATISITTSATAVSVLGFANGTTRTYSGNGDSVYIWGAQLNAGTTAQPYQVTTSAARSGDGFVTKWYTQDSNGENLYLQSQTFTAVNWNKVQSAVTANAGTDPFGGNNATRWLSNVGANIHNLHQLNTLTVGQSYNVSFWVKSNTGSNQLFRLFGCDIVISSDLTATNDWQRFQFTFVATSNTAHGITRPASNAAVDLLIYGAQLSQSTWLQPYQVTTTTAILRRDASQSTAANQPRIVGGGVIERENGKAAIRFDSNPEFLQIASNFSTFNSTSIFSVVKPDNYNIGGDNARFYDLYDGVYHIQYLRGSASKLLHTKNTLWQNFNDSTQYTTKIAPTSQFLSSVISLSSSTDLYFNSYIQNKVSASNVGSAGAVSVIGQRSDILTSTNFFGGYQELLVYQSNLTSTRADIERNIGAYYQTHWTGASSGLLDQFGGAAAAYSLRNLSSSYRGPLIRVRRSSDNAETDIGGTYSGDLDVASLLSFTGGQNLLLNSDNFTAASWGLGGLTVTSNVTIAPDGTLTADSLNETATNQNHVIFQTTNPSVAGPITSSVYLKAKERRYVSLSVATNGPTTFIRYGVIVDLQEGVITRSDILRSASGVYYSVSNAGNGWWRVSVSINATTVGVNSNFIVIALSNSPNPVFASDTLEPSYLGVAGSGVYIWGAQLNTGILQPYIPTTTTAVNGANAFVTKWYTQDDNYQNLLLQSEAFEAINWTKINSSVTTNATIAPNGTNTAERLTENTTSALHFVSYNNAGLAGLYTLSFYAKADSRSWCYVTTFDGSTDRGAYFNLSNGAIGSVDAGATALIQSVGNGWYRCIVTGSPAATFGASIQLAVANNQRSYLGDGASGIYIWGAQLNEGSVAQPYTATTNTISQRRDAIQATAAAQPRIVNAGGVESEGNRPAVFWTDGSGMRLTASFPAIPSPQSFFVVNRIGATSGISAAVLFDSYDDVKNIYAFLGNSELPNNRFIYGGPVNILEPANPIPVQYLTNIIHDTVSNIYNNGLLTTTGSSGTFNLSGLSIGHSRGNPNPIATGYEWFGDIQEFLVYPSNLATRLAVNSNINSYYQIYWQGNGTALLDNYSGASAAYSLRNLSSAYTGPLIRVRRSNDNVERDIYGTFGGDLDIASLVAFVGANSGFVTTWYDQSGNARNAVQGTAANQPRIVNAGVVDTQNGKPALNFSTIQDLSIGTPLNYEGVNSSFFMTIRRDNTGNDSILIDSTQNRYLWLNYGATQYYGSVTVVEPDLALANQYMIAAATMNYNVSLKWYKNGNLEQNKTTGFALGQAFNTILYRLYRASVIQTSELIVYPSDVDSSAVQIQSNINNYYKIY